MDRISIGDFARATGLTAKALRLYDQLGLVVPAEVDRRSGYRYYAADQLERARLVARLRRIGMPLDRIRELADLPPAAAAADLTSYWRQVEADTRSRREVVATLVAALRTKEHDMSLDSTHPLVDVASRTGIGQRPAQLDAVLTGRRLHAVADGFGDDPSMARRVLAALAVLDEVTGSVDPVTLLDDAVQSASASVAQLTTDARTTAPAGCTLTAVLFGARQAAVAHVGDSRAYLVRDGRLSRLTRDHTDVASLVDEGRLTEEEARVHERRALLNRALVPGRAAAPDVSLHAVREGDRVVLTTDGVHALLPAERFTGLVVDGGTAEDVVSAVESAVLEAGAPDNYAIVAVDLVR